MAKSENVDSDDSYHPPSNRSSTRCRKRKMKKVESAVQPEEKSPKKTWSCKKCDKVFKTRKLLHAHRKLHRNEINDEHSYRFDVLEDLYICNTCSAEYQDKAEVEKHVETHREIFECTVCLKKLPTAYDHGTHMLIHSTDKILRCAYCSYNTRNRNNLKGHINNSHLKKFYYTCEKCSKGFNDVVAFKEHESEHLGIRPFVCVVCKNDFVYSRYLLSHQIRYHRVGIEGVLLPNECGVCNKIFSKASSVEKHYQLRHVNRKISMEKRHLCDLCGKGFGQKDKLKIHYRVHTGDKPYTCSYCAKSFTTRTYLVMHERVHTGEKPYSCQYCGKCFNQSTPLAIHLRIHTGEKPYICTICSTGCASRGALTLHLKSCRGIPR